MSGYGLMPPTSQTSFRMQARTIPVVPFDYVVFGGTGDLALRKLMPALFERDRDGQIPSGARIFAVARTMSDTATYRAQLAEKLLAGREQHQAAINQFLERIQYVTLDASSDTGWAELAEDLNQKPEHVRVYYFAVAPQLFAAIAARIAATKLITPKCRVVLEKPIGSDLESARAINEAIGQHFAESQIYRIDHYLGKETVQNLYALRFANSLFEPLWNRQHIDHVQITVAETVGLEGRVAYYDQSGAFRDMVQNHLMQLVCLIAMEPPAQYEADAIRDEKLKVLRSLKPVQVGDWVRGQYGEGAMASKAVPSYATELGSASSTETFIAIKLGVENWRWAGVPFYLRTGKRLPEKVSEIVVHFKSVPHRSMPAESGLIANNALVIRLQPNEGMKLALNVKEPGPGGLRVLPVQLDMSFAESFGISQPEAYERLLMDVVRGNQTLFMRADEVSAAWRWATPTMAMWATEKASLYSAGTWGPAAAHTLLARDGRQWSSGA
jgi:glucose-6-phosphate 1-dehydrogenase